MLPCIHVFDCIIFFHTSRVKAAFNFYASILDVFHRCAFGSWINDVPNDCRFETSTRYKSHMSHTVPARLSFRSYGDDGLALAFTPGQEVRNGCTRTLKKDHAKVKQLLEQAGDAKQGKERNAIFAKIKNEMETHAQIEENVFYPAVEKHEELKDMVLESLEEHKGQNSPTRNG
jgi:hypothetical protein